MLKYAPKLRPLFKNLLWIKLGGATCNMLGYGITDYNDIF